MLTENSDFLEDIEKLIKLKRIYNFELKQKNINFILMSTLIKYSNFKSMKQNSNMVKKSAIAKKKVEAEMSAFLRLLSKGKVKKVQE